MKVLIIDDNELVRQDPARSHPGGQQLGSAGPRIPGSPGTLLRFRPDAVVLDLVEGDVTEDVAGNDSFDEIRSSWFCPVVVYSDYQGEQNFKHALVKTIPKGPDSDLAVVQSLQGFTAMAQVIRDVHWEFDKRIREALRDFTPLLREQAGSTANLGDDPVLPRPSAGWWRHGWTRTPRAVPVSRPGSGSSYPPSADISFPQTCSDGKMLAGTSPMPSASC